MSALAIDDPWRCETCGDDHDGSDPYSYTPDRAIECLPCARRRRARTLRPVRNAGTISSTELCDMAGCTYRQLDHWIRMGGLGDNAAIRETGQGRHRRFDADHLRCATAAMRLQVLSMWFHPMAGIPAELVRRLYDAARSLGPEAQVFRLDAGSGVAVEFEFPAREDLP